MVSSQAQTARERGSDPGIQAALVQHQASLYRGFLLLLTMVYMGWWFTSNVIWPGAYNPLWSRLVVVGISFAAFLATCKSKRALRHAETLFYVCSIIVTAHNFQLKYVNFMDVSWAASMYITVVAISALYRSVKALLLYSAFVMGASAYVSAMHGSPYSFYLPGMFTLVIVINLMLQHRMRIERRLAAVMKEAAIERRKLEKAEDDLKTRNEFISIASHELKTPLTSLKLYLDMICGRKVAADRLADIAEKAREQSERLVRLINVLLDIPRIESGVFELTVTEFDLRELVDRTVANLSADFAEAGVKISLEGPESLVVRADRERIDQVLSNLLKNASIYGREKPVSIALSGEAESVTLVVRDQGIGISKEDQRRIFGRFERAVPVRKYGGLGLGLYIVRMIVRAHAGEITVRSELGQGAEFTVRIPRNAALGSHRVANLEAPTTEESA